VRLVEHSVGKGAEPVGVHGLNMGGAFNSVGRSAIRGNIERLVWVLGPIEVIRTEDLVPGVQVVIDTAKYGGVALFMNNKETLVGVLESGRKSRGFEEMQESHALAFSARGDDRVIHANDWSSDGTSSAERSAKRRAIQVFTDALTSSEEKRVCP